MQKQSNITILEILKYLYLRTDEEHPVTVADILDYLNGKGIHAVRQTVYGDLQDLILLQCQQPGEARQPGVLFSYSRLSYNGREIGLTRLLMD